MDIKRGDKYLFLDDIANILGKSWSFCQKEVKAGRLIGEKKYILGKRKFVIKKNDFINYIKNHPERVGTITDFQENVENISKTIGEMERPSYNSDIKEQYNYTPTPTKSVEVKEKEEPTNKETKKSETNNYSLQLGKILEQLNNVKEGGSNNLYIEQLKTTIEDLKKSKDDEKGEYKNRIGDLEEKINSLQEEVKYESKKVERSFFISDRYEKTLAKQNELLLNIITLAKTLGEGNQVSLGDLKSLISAYGVNEKVVIDEKSSDIKLINETNNGFYEKLKLIDEDIIIEKSRKDEIEGKNNELNILGSQLKKKNLFIYIICGLIILFGLTIIIGKYLLKLF